MDKAMHSEFEVLPEELRAEVRLKAQEYLEPRVDLWTLGVYEKTLVKHVFEEIYFQLVHPKEKENQSLRSELQKQKELNDELVAYVDDLLEDHKNCPWMIDNGHRAESLIKKSKES